MSVSLEEIERQLVAEELDSPLALAMVARIRELENALDSCGDYSRHGDRIRAVILKGVVVP